jgi:hypothetical protein
MSVWLQVGSSGLRNAINVKREANAVVDVTTA